MGVIQKQSLLYSLTRYVGLGISVVVSLFIYPLDIGTYGLFQFILSLSQLLFPLLTLGFVSATVKYYPEYKAENKTGELLVTAALAIIVICSLFLIVYPWVYPSMYRLLEIIGFDTSKLENLQGSIFGIAVAGAFATLLSTYISNYKKIVIPAILMELSLKLVLPLLIVLKVFGGWTIDNVIAAFLIYNLGVTIVLGVYMRYLNREKLSLPTSYTKSKLGSIAEYSIYNMFNALAYTLVYRLDIIMITLLLGEVYTGYYSLLLFISNVIEIPGKGVAKITAPLISDLMESKNYLKVKELYQKASLNLMLVSGMVGVVIYAGLEPLLSLVKDGNILISYMVVWILLVVGKWINQTTGINSHVINYSEKFRWNFYFMGVQALMNLVMNYYLINRYGLVGAAIATTVSIILNNLLKMFLVKYYYDMWPLKKESLSIVLFLLFFTGLIYFIPFIDIPLLDIGLRCSIVGLLMIYIAYKFSFSQELNGKLLELRVVARRKLGI